MIENSFKITLVFQLLFWSSIMLFSQNDTIYFDASNNVQHVKWRHRYDKKLTMKLFLAQAGYDGKLKRKDNGEIEVFINFEQTLEVIKKMDKLSLGIPKIIYLVGWQYNGHDSKYPAFFEGNDALKREEDPNALESLKWLMNESKKFNTTVSLHIGMFDAYEDSPLWDTYVKNDIIAKNKDGSLRSGEWGYPISYAQEWKKGFTQKRIDSLCAILPIAEAGTVHVDAFHTWAPIGKEGPGKRPFIKEPISPYLEFSVADETEAQKKIFKYWESKGIDVTSEGAMFLREDTFAGYQSMAWWVDWGLAEYMKWPAFYYTGGEDEGDNGKLFGTSMHGEVIVKKDPKNITGFKNKFSNTTLIWYYLNTFLRQKYIENTEGKKVFYSDGVVTQISKEEYTIHRNGRLLVQNQNVFVPALWMKNKSIIAYSKEGYTNKSWQLPEDWKGIKKLELSKVTLKGNVKKSIININHGFVKLDMEANEMLLLESKK